MLTRLQGADFYRVMGALRLVTQAYFRLKRQNLGPAWWFVGLILRSLWVLALSGHKMVCRTIKVTLICSLRERLKI